VSAPETSQGVELGDSVAVDGVCLTVVACADSTLSFDVVPETLARTSLGTLDHGSRVNLEPSLRAGDAMGGHVVQGHVDGVGTVRGVEAEGDGRRVWFDAPSDLLRYVVEKGSIAILAGNQNAPNLRKRADGVKQEAAKYSGMKIVDTFYHLETPQDAAAEVMRVQNAYPQIQGWAMIGGWPLFTPSLLSDLDPKKVKIVAVDALPPELPYVEKGLAPVLLAQPTDEAFRPAHHVRFYSALWAAVALLLIAVLGVVLSRGLTGPMEKLSRAVAQLGDGRYDVDLDIERGDEIGRFADAFRRMAGDLRRRDDEIRRWNAELQARVDQGTRELRTAQDQILRTRRLAALGSLGAGIAHELNNPLTAVTGLLTLLRLDLQPDSPQAATIQQALDQSFRMAKIVSELRAFAEQERGEGLTFPLDRPVRAALDHYAGQLARQNIRVVTDLAASSRQTQGDLARIQRAVANVVENAIQAMPQGGELKVELTDVGGEALKLSISDTGEGIPAALRERIFDPFFTTKKSGAGVGMGLSVSHSIVEAHHGRIVVESEEGKGATFTIFLPAAAPAAHLA